MPNTFLLQNIIAFYNVPYINTHIYTHTYTVKLPTLHLLKEE